MQLPARARYEPAARSYSGAAEPDDDDDDADTPDDEQPDESANDIDLDARDAPTDEATGSGSGAQARPRVDTANATRKASQRRKYKQLNTLAAHHNQPGQHPLPAVVAPRLAPGYVGRARENERAVVLTPKLRVLNQVEVCDMELAWAPLAAPGESAPRPALPFVVSWIDRVSGDATLEARREDLMNCERQRNFTFQVRAIGCNGLASNE